MSDAALAPAQPKGPILFFDGVCNVCSASVHFVLAHESAPTLTFASLQSPLAQQTLPPFGINPADLDSVVLYENGKVHTRSTAALQTSKYMKAPWRWLWAFRVVPRVVRDFVYLIIARNRYRWFGKKDACMIPTPALRARFADA